MQYALLIYEDESATRKAESGPAFEALVKQHMVFSGELRAKGIQTGGGGLKASLTATTVKEAAGSRTIHDGPFAESKEQLGGFYIVDVPDLDSAIALVKRMPMADGGSVEIRPLLGPG
jgi:hypothetical protein